MGSPGSVGSVRDQAPQRVKDGGRREAGFWEVGQGDGKGVVGVVMGGVSIAVKERRDVFRAAADLREEENVGGVF